MLCVQEARDDNFVIRAALARKMCVHKDAIPLSAWVSAIGYRCRLSTITAIPCPPPMHAVESPYFALRRRSS